MFAIPTYGSTFIYNTNFTQITNIGVYAGAQPIGKRKTESRKRKTEIEE